MIKRHINMRMQCSYEGEKNTITNLRVEHEIGREWLPLDLGVTTAGFDVFVYAMFNCQHTYFRINSAERDLVLASAEGRINVTTDMEWNLLDIDVQFTGQLDSGLASENDIEYIRARMQQCPVFRNVRTPEMAKAQISLVSQREQKRRRRDPAVET